MVSAWRDTTLSDVAGGHLLARCGSPWCDQATAFNPAAWLAEGLGTAPLHLLSGHFRRVCGCRQADLEPRSGPVEPSTRLGLVAFR